MLKSLTAPSSSRRSWMLHWTFRNRNPSLEMTSPCHTFWSGTTHVHYANGWWSRTADVTWTTFRGYTTIAAPGPGVWWKCLRGVGEQIPVPPDVSSPVARACTADCGGRHLPAQSHAHTVPWSPEWGHGQRGRGPQCHPRWVERWQRPPRHDSPHGRQPWHPSCQGPEGPTEGV